jgi:formylglycine-generating enzyme required for sulfatase activity
MKTVISVIRPVVLVALTLATWATSTRAQEVSIPDPGLNAAVRAALQKPTGPLTEQDLLSLTNLDASRRNVGSIDGLQAARNLVGLDLQINLLADFSLPAELTNLLVLNLSDNPLTNFLLPSGLTSLTSLTMEAARLTNLDLPAGLSGLTNLDLENNQLAGLNLPSNLTSLVALDLGFNALTSFSLPTGLTNLSTFYFAGNPLTNVVLPPGLSGMTELNLSQNQLTDFTLPAGMTSLAELDLSFNQLTNLALPSDLKSLTELDLDYNQFTGLNLPSNLTNLSLLHLRGNQFTNFDLSAELPGLTYLDVSTNPLTKITLPLDLTNLMTLRLSDDNLSDFTFPFGLTNLVSLFLASNQLTNVVLPTDLAHLDTLNLSANQLTSFTVPAGLSNLTGLFFVSNQLTNLTLPPDMTRLTQLGFLGNPLTELVLPAPLAATSLASIVATLQSQGVSVFTYPLTVQLVRPRPLVGAFQFGIIGPPGVYSILQSADLATWSVLGATTNSLGSISFVDPTTHLSPIKKFYRALQLSPPTNMVFIAPNTFVMGSPETELHRQQNEGPQTTVTLTRGFWIGKYEVTQGEYLSVVGTNPSVFPGDPSRPVSSVSWPDATNYCWILTQRELAAGRIPVGSQYRLPTEAEWECAARAGTTTRFYYGDDLNYSSLTNYAWFFLNGALTVHQVGQKLPNPWGLYDMEGNVWEWCQDWLGDLPGGAVSDPQGPPSNAIGWKVIRGGAYDFDVTDCRSARRYFYGSHPGLTDSDLGFRVVLAPGSQ